MIGNSCTITLGKLDLYMEFTKHSSLHKYFNTSYQMEQVKETGWAPHHLVVREEGGESVLGCCPIYMKVFHSLCYISASNMECSFVI